MKAEDWMMYIHCDWELNLDRDDCQAWVTYKQIGGKTVHGKLKKTGISIDALDGTFRADIINKHVMEVVHIESNSCVRFIAPQQIYKDLISGSKITNVDVSEGGLGVVTSDNDQMYVWATDTGSARRQLKGHLGEVYSAKLFPSGLVVLSTGADMRIKIWSATTGDCPVTLTGHTQPVTDTAIVTRGKNIVSVSKDGSVRLWSCGEGKCITVLASGLDQLNCCAITEHSCFHPLDFPDRDDMELNSPEVDTEGKVLAVGSENGQVQIINVAARSVIHSYSSGSPVNCVTWSPSHLIIGCQDGSLHKISRSGQHIERSSSSPVLCLRYIAKLGSLVVGRQDGSVTVDSNSTDVRIILTGSDTDPIYSVSDDGTSIFTACRDGIVRKYDFKNIKNSFK